MDWTFWVGAVVIVGLLIVTQVFLHENRWSRRPRPEEPEPESDPSSEPEPTATAPTPESDSEAPEAPDRRRDPDELP